MTVWDWNLYIPEFQTLQEVNYLALNSLEGVIQKASSTGSGGWGCLAPAIPGLVGPPPRGHPSQHPRTQRQ